MKVAIIYASTTGNTEAMADAIKQGKMGVMDYYKLQNLTSDTAMRNAIAGNDTAGTNNKKPKF